MPGVTFEVEPVAAMAGVEVFYTGPRLDQGDLDVLGVLHLCRTKAMGERCYFTAYELLKLLGKNDTGGNTGAARCSMFGCRACVVRVCGCA